MSLYAYINMKYINIEINFDSFVNIILTHKLKI